MDTCYEIETIKVRLTVSEEPTRSASYSEKVVSILRAVYQDLDADQEHFIVLALDQKNHVRGYKVLFTGGQTRSNVDFRNIFRIALLFGATKIIIAHNHPGGDPEPSIPDRTTTEEVARLGNFLNIPLMDHIILGTDSFFSFLDRNLLKHASWWSDSIKSCYHRFGEEVLEEIRQLLPLAGDVTQRRIRRLLRDRGLSPTEWKRLKLSEDEELRIIKENFLARFADWLRKADVEKFEALTNHLLEFLAREQPAADGSRIQLEHIAEPEKGSRTVPRRGEPGPGESLRDLRLRR